MEGGRKARVQSRERGAVGTKGAVAMSDIGDFRELIGASARAMRRRPRELVRRYEPMVRRVGAGPAGRPEARQGARLDGHLPVGHGRASSSRAALGQYDLETPDRLLKLLATMARNKLANHAHGQRAARRDVRRVDHGEARAAEVADRGGTPSRALAARELLDEARAA